MQKKRVYISVFILLIVKSKTEYILVCAQQCALCIVYPISHP